MRGLRINMNGWTQKHIPKSKGQTNIEGVISSQFNLLNSEYFGEYKRLGKLCFQLLTDVNYIYIQSWETYIIMSSVLI